MSNDKVHSLVLESPIHSCQPGIVNEKKVIKPLPRTTFLCTWLLGTILGVLCVVASYAQISNALDQVAPYSINRSLGSK